MSQSQPGRDAAVSTFVRAPKRESSLQTVASASSRGKQPGIAQMPSGKVASPPLGSRSPKSSVMRSSGPLAPRLAHQAPKSRSSMTSAAPVDAFGGDVASGGTHGLGFKLEDPAFTAPLHIKKRSLTAPASSSPKSPSSPPPALNSQRKATASSPTVMPFPEFCIPELSDAASAFEQQFLLSPFTLSSPNFPSNVSAAAVASPAASAASPSPIAAATPAAISSSAPTPTSPPRQRFFEAGSASSMPRFPTPDKLALGFTPSPMNQPVSMSLLSPASTSAKEAQVKMARSPSANTVQSESSIDSLSSSPSSSDVSEAFHDASAPRNEAVVSVHRRSESRPSRSERHDIRESLMHFPSPPTSPRVFNFGNMLDTSLPYAAPSLSSSKCSSAATPALTGDVSSEGHSTTDDNRPSLDEIMHAQMSRQDAVEEATKPEQIVQPLLPELSAVNLLSHTERISLSLPPLSAFTNAAQPQIDERSTHAAAVPPQPTRVPPQAPVTEHVAGQSQLSKPAPFPLRAPAKEDLGLAAGFTPPPRAPILRSSKSTESFMGRLRSNAGREARPSPLQLAVPSFAESSLQAEEREAARKRKTSLSIKIPKILAKLKKNDELLAPALPDTPLGCPASRFSPDSEAPSPAPRKQNFAQRLSRAVSSPNLKATASKSAPSPKLEQVFTPPASAPPLPVTFLSPPLPSGASFMSPLPTPGLMFDGASVASGSPHTGTDFNPFFPPTSQIPTPNTTSSWVESKASQPVHGGIRWQQAQQQDKQQSLAIVEAKGKSTNTTSSEVPAAGSDDSGNSSAGPSDAGTSSPLKTSHSGSSSGGSDEDDEGDKSQAHSSHNDDSFTDYGGSEDDSEDDDKPLAQAHPDAIKAQKSLRQKENERTKRSKSSKSGKGPDAGPAPHDLPVGPAAGSASQSVSRSASAREPASMQHRPLPRKKNTAPIPVRNPFGFAPDELSQKLKGIDLEKSRTGTIKQEQKRPESSGSRPHALLLPQTDEQVKRRNRANGKHELAPPLAPFVQDSVLTMSEGSDDDDDVPLAANTSVQSSSSKRKQTRASANNRPPIDTSRVQSSRQPAQVVLPLAPSPVAPGPAELALAKKPAYQSRQRIYINDPQHHSSFDIDERTTPAHILAHLRAKNAISDNPAYVVVEMWRSLGVERTLREYEYLQDCIESWGNDANSSLFLVKKSNMATVLREAAPGNTSANVSGSWLQMETKRGKWSKRWLEIRNHSVFVGKSEKPRDQTFVCGLANFDAYLVPQACIAKLKAPKPFAFAIKSTDKVTLFENADQDYVHFFSVKTEAERDQWIQRILECRSPLVKQTLATRASAQAVDTRSNVISQPLSAQPSSSSSASLSRASSSRHASPQMPSTASFAENSLLARAASTLGRAGPSSPTAAVPPMPSFPLPQPTSGAFQTIPQGRDWERLGHDERQRRIHEAEQKARDGGKTLLDFSNTGPGGRDRSKSITRR